VQELIEACAGFLCLVYHEARNVRHLVRDGHITDKTPYRMLIDGLSRNPYNAWKQLQKSRKKAVQCRTAGHAEAIFSTRFKLSLKDLRSLFTHHAWKHSRLGGNKWVIITERVIRLREAIDNGEEAEARNMVVEIRGLPHHTGIIVDKLYKLDRSRNT